MAATGDRCDVRCSGLPLGDRGLAGIVRAQRYGVPVVAQQHRVVRARGDRDPPEALERRR